MNDVRAHLERARREAPDVATGPAGLDERREAKARRKRVTTIVVASAIGLLPIALGVVIVGGGSGRGGSPAVSGSEIGTPTLDLRLKPGDYYYLRVDPEVDPTIVYETWWATDDSGRIAKVSGSEGGYGIRQGTYGPGEFFSDSGSVAYLSTDPAELDRQLRARVQPGGASPEPYGDWGGSIEWGLIRSIGELLDSPDVTPAQKAALMQVTANLDGVTVDLHALDPAGRMAILLTADTEQTIQRWWFDPESHQVLAMAGTFNEIVRAAGITSSTDSTDLTTKFFATIG